MFGIRTRLLIESIIPKNIHTKFQQRCTTPFAFHRAFTQPVDEKGENGIFQQSREANHNPTPPITTDAASNNISTQMLPKRRHPDAYDANLPYFSDRAQNYFIRILLIRHGESYGNKDKAVLKVKADHAVPLTDQGVQQAKEAARQLVAFYENEERQQEEQCKIAGIPFERRKRYTRLWTSPYRRARETADQIMEIGKGLITDKREHILLGEQQFGLFEGHSIEELHQLYPQEYAHFTKCIDSEGRFWARMPLGESRFDVAKRVHQAFGSFHRDAQFHGINDIIVVSHGVTIRALLMMWLHKSPEWFEHEMNPRPCSIRLIENNLDKGYIFNGFEKIDSGIRKFGGY